MIEKNKRGVSEIISYVLLISITFAIAGMIYGWLVFYVTPGEEVRCNDGVSLTIRSYNYSCFVSPTTLNVSLQNRGLFDIDGYIIRVNTKQDATLGVYTIVKEGNQIPTAEIVYSFIDNAERYYSGSSYKELDGVITFLEVQPFQRIDGEIVYCDKIAKQEISCTTSS